MGWTVTLQETGYTVAIGSGANTLAGLLDTAISDPADTEGVFYNADTGKWENGAAAVGAAWGAITGDLGDQADLDAALDAKEDAGTAASAIAAHNEADGVHHIEEIDGQGFQNGSFAQVVFNRFTEVTSANMLATIGAQAASAKLTALAALAWAADSLLLFTGTGTAAVQALASHVLTFLQSASAADARAAIGAADTAVHLVVAASDEDSDLAIATPAITFRMPHAMTLTEVRANVNTAPSGSAIQVDINEGGVSILSTKITIDAGTTTSEAAATPPVISDTALADNAIVSIDIDAVGSVNPGKGLKITFIGTRP